MHSEEFLNGITSDGKKVTLYKAFEIDRTQNFSGLTTSTYLIELGFWGEHFHDINELHFDTISANLNNLDTWVNLYGFERISFNDYKSLGIKYTAPEPINLKVNDELTAKINFLHSFNRSKSKVSFEQRSELTLYYSSKKDFLDLRKDLLYFEHFLTIGTFDNSFPQSISLWNQDNSSRISLYYKNGIPGNKRMKSNWEFFFTYADISTIFESLIQNWFSKREKIEVVVGLLLENAYSRLDFNENNFLNLMQALETYHRRNKNNYVLSETAFKEKLSSIYDSIPHEYKTWLREILHNKNEPSLALRLKELLTEADTPSLNVLIPKKDEIVSIARDSRNYYTHYSREMEKKAAKGKELLTLTEKWRLVLVCNILRDLGISSEKLDEWIAKKLSYLFPHLKP